MTKKYSDKLRDPRWQKLAAEVKTNAGWACERCGSKTETLAAHHKFYVRGREPWEYEHRDLECLCWGCHDQEHGLKELMAMEAARHHVSLEQMLGYVHGCALRCGTIVSLNFDDGRPDYDYLIGLCDVYRIAPERLAILFDRVFIKRLTDEDLGDFFSFSRQLLEQAA